jgi:hypothetical protein
MKALVAVALALLPSTAFANSPYPDCAAPSTAYGKVWHIDPANGDSPAHGADGSVTHPYDSWAAVTLPKQPGYPAAPLLASMPYNGHAADGPSNDASRIQPGDQIVLHNGNYGDLALSSYNQPINNVVDGKTRFVTISAAPGEVPRFTTGYISGARGFVLDGLTFRAANNEGAANSGWLLRLSDQGAAAPTQDIIIQNAVIESADASSWTQEQLRTRLRGGVYILGGDRINSSTFKCATLQDSRISWTRAGVSNSFTTNVAVVHNQIQFFTGDGVDCYSCSNFTIDHNVIEDRVDAADGAHSDGVQMARFSSYAGPFHNVRITNNKIYRLTSPDNHFPGYLQGVYNTDETYDHTTISGNLLITWACHGLELKTGTNSVFAQNTAIWDGFPRSSGCSTLNISAGGTNNTFINNVVTGSFGRPSCTDGGTWQNNLAVSSIAGGQLSSTQSAVCKNGVFTQFAGNGEYDGVTVNSAAPLNQVFTTYAPPASGLYSPDAINPAPAPGGLLDGKGAPFGPPPNIGAY